MKGTLRIEDLAAPSLQGNPLGDPSTRQTPVYLPPGYASSTERYPVVYFLHGFMGTGMGWTHEQHFTPNVPQRIDALIAAGMPPFIGIFLDGATAFGGTQWINSAGMGRYGDFVARDAVAWADTLFRTVPKREARAVVGKSSGGYGAFAMMATHSETFAHAAAHSGDAYFEYCYQEDFPKAAGALLKAGGVKAWFDEFVGRAKATKSRGDDFPVIGTLAMAATYSPSSGEPLGLQLPFDILTGRIRQDVFGRWLEQDPVRFIPARIEHVRAMQSIFIDCGTKDEFHLRWGARMVAEALVAAKVPHVHEEFEDGHMGIGYRYERSLGYLVPRLARG